jgi:hypothetical protein
LTSLAQVKFVKDLRVFAGIAVHSFAGSARTRRHGEFTLGGRVVITRSMKRAECIRCILAMLGIMVVAMPPVTADADAGSPAVTPAVMSRWDRPAPAPVKAPQPAPLFVRAERMTRAQRLDHGELLRRYAPESVACLEGIAHSETAHRLAPRLLLAIGLVESGRPDRLSGRLAPWPWTINVAGIGYFFDTKQAAITAVQAVQAAGIRSIDVGCMQVNLLQHPHAFATLEDAFDPETNAQYGGRFLQQLQAALGSWPAAAGAYHSMTPELAIPYVARIASFWPEAKPFAALPGVPIAARAGEGAGTMPEPMRLLLAGMALRDPVAKVDPLQVMTPEFRSRLADEAAGRAARLAAMGLLPPAAGGTSTKTPAHPLVTSATAQQRAPVHETLRTAWR